MHSEAFGRTDVRFILLAVYVFVVSVTSSLVWGGQGVDGWRGPERTGVFPGEGFPTSLDPNENLAWEAEMPGLSIAQPVVSGQTVVVLADPAWVIAYDLKTGKEKWRTSVDPIELGLFPGQSDRRKEDVALREILYAAGWIRVGCGDGYSWRGGQSQLDAVYDVLSKAPKVAKHFSFSKKLAKDSKTLQSAMGEIAGYLGSRYGFAVPGWKSLIGYTPATPVVDETSVYVCMAMNQVAALDLVTGKIRWVRMVIPSRNKKGRRTLGHRARYVASPLLVDGKLFTQAGYRVSCFDAETGKVLWSQDRDIAGGGYRCGSPVHLRLQPDDVDVVATSDGKITRLSDGEILCKSYGPSWCGSETGGDTALTNGTDTLYYYSGRNSGGDLLAIRLKLQEDGSVQPSELWRTKVKGPGGASGVLAGDVIIRRHVEMYDAQTGNLINDGRGLRVRGSWASPALADGYLFVLRSDKFRPANQVRWNVLKVGEKGMQKVSSGELSSPHQPVPQLRKWAPDWLKQCRKRGDYNPCETGFVIHGDKVLLRTKSRLYCFGPGGK